MGLTKGLVVTVDSSTLGLFTGDNVMLTWGFPIDEIKVNKFFLVEVNANLGRLMLTISFVYSALFKFTRMGKMRIITLA